MSSHLEAYESYIFITCTKKVDGFEVNFLHHMHDLKNFYHVHIYHDAIFGFNKSVCYSIVD
jgi:hypothetical protein